MDRDSILRLIAELRRRHGGLEGVEAKAAHTGTPADLFKPISAFANHAGGGILLFGLDEDASFEVVGVGNPRKLQEDLSGLASQMEPPLRPSFSVEEIEVGTVVAVDVSEVAYYQKPCYHRPAPPPGRVLHPCGKLHPADEQLRDLQLHQLSHPADI